MTTLSILLLLTRICVLFGVGKCSFRYDSITEKILCRNQCNALCSESQRACTNGLLSCSLGNETTSAYWMSNCDIPHCVGTCNTLKEHFDYTRVLDVPDVILVEQTGSHVVLSWTSSNSVFIVYYVVQMRAVGQSKWINVISEAQLTRFQIPLPDVCGQYDFRVMAINEYGSDGFSAVVRAKASVPSPVPNIQYTEGGMYYVPDSETFQGIIQWDSIPGWNETDIQIYYWNPNPERHCRSLDSNIQPIFFKDKKAGVKKVLMQFHKDAFGCTYTTQVQAISRCGVKGVLTNFTVDLSDCRFLKRFPCQLYTKDNFDPPGQVENVTTSANNAEAKNIFGGERVTIKLNWDPPSDLGTMGMVDHYIIRWGPVQINQFPVQPTFLGEPNKTKIQGDSVGFGVQVDRDLNAVYGFQIIPVAPEMLLLDTALGLYAVHTISVSRPGNSKITDGKVLYDDPQVRVMKIHNAFGVEVSWHIQQARNLPQNETDFYDRYAVQWGKPDSERSHLLDTESTVVPSISSKLKRKKLIAQKLLTTVCHGCQFLR